MNDITRYIDECRTLTRRAPSPAEPVLNAELVRSFFGRLQSNLSLVLPPEVVPYAVIYPNLREFCTRHIQQIVRLPNCADVVVNMIVDAYAVPALYGFRPYFVRGYRLDGREIVQIDTPYSDAIVQPQTFELLSDAVSAAFDAHQNQVTFSHMGQIAASLDALRAIP